ncbi:hypothetical protein [Wolbachia endosymbiont (group A) of Norellia spinipes]|uniref:hypothetical protein n=1 Tax=Wolbachia endosymbiont (group A) of Norellia spinipes TaxID=3066150 RepID=UPI0036D858E1
MKITEYLQFHDKGAGGVCQVAFSFLFPMLYGYARSLIGITMHECYFRQNLLQCSKAEKQKLDFRS